MINKFKILNCYDLAETSAEFHLDKLVEESQKETNNDLLVWNHYNYKNHEFILLFKNKIVIGDFKDKVDIMNLEFY